MSKERNGPLINVHGLLTLQKWAWVNPAEGKTSEGGLIDILRELEEITQGELQQGSGT
jgi:hypothetical protein